MAPALRSPLVSTQWLADHLGAEGLLVVDATVLPFTQPNGSGGYLTGHEQYLVDGHVPGAVFADLIEEFSDPDAALKFTRPSVERFAAAASALGIAPGTTVVVYDSQQGQWAARFWWLLRAFGHEDSAVLDGGLTSWRAEGRDTETGHVEPVPAEFAAHERPELWADRSDVEAVLAGEREAALVCALPRKDFSGEIAPRGRAGHIPGSVNAPAIELVDREARTVRPEEELRGLFGSALDAPEVIVYCAAGIAATSAALALTVLGQRVAVYDGSLNEWTADPDAALETSVPA